MSHVNEERTISGQVVHKRTPSRKMCFFDVLVSEDECGGPPSQRETVVLKSWASPPDVMKRALKGNGKIHVGDRVVFQVEYDDTSGAPPIATRESSVQEFAILHRWGAGDTGGKAFVPVPPSPRVEVSDSGKPCKFWLNSGQCPKGESCGFVHLLEHEKLIEARQKYVKDKFGKRDELQQQPHHHSLSGLDEHDLLEGDSGQSGLLTSRHQRAEIFSDFLARTFPHSMSNASQVILDVGGGARGDVAFELKVKQKVQPRIVTVDPRGEAQVRKRWQTKMLKKTPEADQPEHLSRLFDETLLAEYQGQVALVIGMHPDEATEPIVNLSLGHGIPFAVVPCCVFAHQNPDRRLQGEDQPEPTTYELFCQYLKEKNPGIVEESLGFRGRDKVIYWLPPPNN